MWLANRYRNGTQDTWSVAEIDDSKSRVTYRASISDRKMSDGYNYIVLLPFGNYIPKHKWNPLIDEGYTIDTNDVIFFENPGDVNADNIAAKKREIPSLEVRQFFVVDKKFSTRYQIKVIG